jgi:hypothetical protein
LANSIFAQKPKSKDELFKEIVTLSNTKKPEDTEKAYQLSKEYLSRFPKEKDAEKIRPFVKNYRMFLFGNALNDKKFADFFTLGKEILGENAENVEITLNLAYGGYMAALNKDNNYTEDSAKYAQTTLQLMEKGVFPKEYAPFTSKDEALGWMNFINGFFTSEKDGKASASSMYKATLYETPIKNSSQPYLLIANYYEAVYEKMVKDKAEATAVSKIVDQLLDAYARAYTFGVVEKNPAAENWKQRIAQVYKFTKGTDAGLEAYIKYIVSTPFKDPANF